MSYGTLLQFKINNLIMLQQVQNDTLNKVVSDTLIAVSDTINLSLKNAIKLYQGDEELIVKTLAEPKTLIEEWGLWIASIAAVITIVYTLFALKKLLSKDEQLQSQINELVNLNKLFERRLRMIVKPRLIINGTGTMGKEKTFTIYIHNLGEVAYYKGFEMVEGSENISINKWKVDVPIYKGQQIVLGGHFRGDPKELYFKFIIKYYDAEKYNYESLIEWNGDKKSIIETREL